MTTIALLVLLASVSSSTSVKLRRPRKRPTLRVPHQQARLGPVIVRVIHRYTDELAGADASNCTGPACRDAGSKLDLDTIEALAEQDNFLPDQESLRYIVYPKKYEHFVSKKHTGHGSRYRRQVAQEAVPWSDGNASKALRNESKAKLKKVTLLKISKRIWTKEPIKSLSEASRSRRSIDSNSSRRNASDYYAQRRAVMEKYYARQREINARYANRTNNATLFTLGLDSGNSTTRNVASSAVRRPLRIIPYNETLQSNKVDRNHSRTTSNVRSTLNPYVTFPPCVNVSLPGIFTSKILRHVTNCSRDNDDDDSEEALINESVSQRPIGLPGIVKGLRFPVFYDLISVSWIAIQSSLINIRIFQMLPNVAEVMRFVFQKEKGEQVWGTCRGKLVYQHNLLLGLTGPSNLRSLFEVYIEDSICITCVKAVPYNDTSAVVVMDSGGHGHDYVKLRLEGHKNEGFSYIIKIWAVRKIDRCEV